MQPSDSTSPGRGLRRPLLGDLYRYLAMAKVVVRYYFPARRYPYRGRRRMLRDLGSDLASMTTWPAADSEPHGEMAEVVKRTSLVHKFAHHLPIYESVVERIRPIRMLEIGSFYGDSVQMWHEYLHADSVIVGVDVKSRLLKIGDSQGIHVRFGDEQDESFLSAVAAELGPFDVIVDAGSHTSTQMVDAFRRLFADALTERGVYVVEDVHHDYWKKFRDSRVSFIDFVRALIDAMHDQYRDVSSESAFRVGHPDRIEAVTVPAITPMLGGIEIYDSLVVVRRADRELTRNVHQP